MPNLARQVSPRLAQMRHETERGLDTEDQIQDHLMMAGLYELKERVAMAIEINKDPQVGAILDAIYTETCEKLHELEEDDRLRHKKRAAITEFKAKEARRK